MGLKRFAKVGVTISLVAASLFSVLFGYARGTGSHYKSDEQVAAIVSELDSDDSLLQESRIAHNGFLPYNNNNKPICVSFSKEYEGTRYKRIAINALDYIFGLLSEINDNYSYKVVSTPEVAVRQGFGESVIRFYEKDLVGENKSAHGTEQSKRNLIDIFSGKNMFSDIFINADFDLLNKCSDEYVFYVFVHELTHGFGRNDVYDKSGINYPNGINYDTYMFVRYPESIFPQMLTPDDYVQLLSEYSKKYNTDAEKEACIQRCKYLLQEYKNKYYQTFADTLNDKFQTDGKKIKNAEAENYNFSRTIVYTDGEMAKHLYQLEVKDGRYKLTILNDDGEVIDCAKGEVIQHGNYKFLKNIYLKHGITPLNKDDNSLGKEYGITETFVLFNLYQNEADHYSLYIPHDNDLNFINVGEQTENSEPGEE